MLVQCGSCGVSFDHSMGRCIACGSEYVPTRDELLEQMRVRAVNLLESGAKCGDAVRDIEESAGLSHVESQEVVRDAVGRLRTRSRQQGRHIAASGIVLLAIALGVYVLFQGLVIATGCIALGGVMVLIGVLKAATGWNLTGHDDN